MPGERSDGRPRRAAPRDLPGVPVPHLWCAAPPGAQQELAASEPARFFRPPYVGGRGWVGVRLDQDIDWAEIAELCQDAYRVIAPARLVALLG